MNYYNEIDRKAAVWLRELIERGLISKGVVDERSIEDVTPGDLAGFAQCHFFAGIGVWSHALRSAGWPDDKPVWTGSCPCQPFSAAGKGAGFNDERHLWPALHWLIRQCRPSVIFGEQVAHKAGATWFDTVSTDLEGENYTCGKVVFPACGVGSPHLRQRQYWVGHSSSEGPHHRLRREVSGSPEIERFERSGSPSELADSKGIRGNEGLSDDSGWTKGGDEGQGPECFRCGDSSELADANRGECNGKSDGERSERDRQEARRIKGDSEPPSGGELRGTGPTNGHWRDADWLFCQDDKWRPAESSTFPLAHGAPARVGRLRGYGNAIVAPQAQAFIESYLESSN